MSDESRIGTATHEAAAWQATLGCRTPAVDGAQVRLAEPFRLYDVADVRSAMAEGHAESDVDEFFGDPEPTPALDDTEHRARLRRILARGDAGARRVVVGPTTDAVDRVSDLGARAPHLGEMTSLVLRHVRAALNVGMPLTLPACVLLGSPGCGKTWYLSKLSRALDIPFRLYQFSSSSLSEGLTGVNPTWRNAKMGLCASMQLSESVSNGLIYVDEVDKPGFVSSREDPYRPFYSLLDPANSAGMIDDYLGFPMDMSRLSWVMSANDLAAFPEPILDRLTVIEVPALSPPQLAAVASSIYGEAASARRNYFDPELGPDVVERLLDMTPRGMRVAIDAALTRAAADGRRSLCADDVRARPGRRGWRAGFIRLPD